MDTFFSEQDKLPSSVRLPSCSLKRTPLGLDWGCGAAGGCMWDRSSASLRLASRSCSVDRLGPAALRGQVRSVSGRTGVEERRRAMAKWEGGGGGENKV